MKLNWRIVLVPSAFALVGGASAIVPKNQTDTDNRVCHLLGLDNDFKGHEGTGTVIGKGYYDADKKVMGLCILTADHVLTKANKDFIITTFKNLTDDSAVILGVGQGVTLVKYYGPGDLKVGTNNPDLAMLVLKVDLTHEKITPAFATYLKGISPAMLGVAPTDDPSTKPFNIKQKGYGVTGDELKNGANEVIGYEHDADTAGHGTGVLRYLNNKIYAYSDLDGGGYKYPAMGYNLDKPGADDRIDGEGIGLSADSGGPMFDKDGKLIGVFTKADSTIAGKKEKVLWDADGVGMRITDDYKKNIEKFCAVPEPGTWAALGLGALAVLRRRAKS